MPRDAAPAVDIGVGADTSGSTLLGNSVLGDAATGTQVVVGSDPGANATVSGAVYDGPSRTAVAMECTYSAT
jgi:hypothetical protein